MNVSDLRAQVATYAHGRVPSALRRKQILAEASELFMERGYHQTSMSELARRVGVSKPVIYNLAGSKDQLFHDVMEAAGNELATALALAVAPHAELDRKLHAGILAFLNFVRERRAGWRALLSMGGGPGTDAISQLRRHQAMLVAAIVADQVGPTSTLEQASVAEALGHAINGAVEFVASWWLEHPNLPAEGLADLLARLLSPGLLAVSKPKA